MVRSIDCVQIKMSLLFSRLSGSEGPYNICKEENILQREEKNQNFIWITGGVLERLPNVSSGLTFAE